MATIDWDGRCCGKAVEAMRRAYAPYSHYPVGVAGLVDDGRVVTGCNVENASYGVTLCAECGLVSALRAPAAAGWSRWRASTRDGDAQPCGRCRQLLWEHGGPDCWSTPSADRCR